MDARNTNELIDFLSNEGSAKYVYFWGPTQRGADVDQSCLSQWFPAPFDHSPNQFQTAEHFMMFRKAELFGDSEIAARILSAPSPGEAKALGRKVNGFSNEAWFEFRWDIAIAGNLAKFSQNSDLENFLLGTGDRVLVEASPVDRIWGIGLDKATAINGHPSDWKGENLLGFALMEVRDQLRGNAD